MSEKKSIIKDKSFTFAVHIIKLYQVIVEDRREYVISKQLLRSETSIGALVREAQNAESKKDFIHKLGISQKECDESIYWLELLKETGFLNQEEFENINNKAIELLKMLRSAIITSKNNTHNS
jgi:four helix bundle protein